MFLLTAEEMRKIEKFQMEEIGIPEAVLMEHAGKSVADKILEDFPEPKNAVVLAGTGQNGGDGMVVARYLLFAGWNVSVWVTGPSTKWSATAYSFYQIVHRLTKVHTYQHHHQQELQTQIKQADVIVDALLGTGTKGSLSKEIATLIQLVNKQRTGKVYSIDLPSGVHANTGKVDPIAIWADVTVAMGYPKWGHFLPDGAKYRGELWVADIGLAPDLLPEPMPAASLNHVKLWPKARRPRDPWSHKGTHGHLLVVGGAEGMIGAVWMTSEAAYRMGAGLVTCAVPEGQASILGAKTFQQIIWPWEGEKQFHPDSATAFLQRADRFQSIVIGPGLGRLEREDQWLSYILENSPIPVVLDADAINMIAEHQDLIQKAKAPLIFTPHPKEMARLCGKTVQEVERDRAQISKKFAVQNRVWLVLKGTYTIITSPEGKQIVNTTGNAALAKAGSGDLLAGMIGSLIAQGLPLSEAIACAVYLHGRTAELACEGILQSLQAEEFLSAIRRAWSEVASPFPDKISREMTRRKTDALVAVDLSHSVTYPERM